jgi:hypothetical protein
MIIGENDSAPTTAPKKDLITNQIKYRLIKQKTETNKIIKK